MLAHLGESFILVSETFWWVIPALIVMFGGVFGSFFNCCLHRIPAGLSLRSPPSHCPQCQTRLTAVDLVPVFSWLMLRGRCRHCQTPVSARYLWVEVLTIGVGLVTWVLIGPQLSWLWVVPLVWAVQLWILLQVLRNNRSKQ